MPKEFLTYQEFWPFYLKQHSKRETKIFHIVGTTFGILTGIAFVIAGHPGLIPLSFVLAYGLAWYSHFFIEKNRPATFQYPFWSFVSDFRMAFLFLTGKI